MVTDCDPVTALSMACIGVTALVLWDCYCCHHDWSTINSWVASCSMAMSQTPSIRMEQGLATQDYGRKGLQVAITT